MGSGSRNTRWNPASSGPLGFLLVQRIEVRGYGDHGLVHRSPNGIEIGFRVALDLVCAQIDANHCGCRFAHCLRSSPSTGDWLTTTWTGRTSTLSSDDKRRR